MYNILMKKISVLLILALLAGFSVQTPCEAGIIANFKSNIAQKKLYKSTRKDIKDLLILQDKLANAHDLEGLRKLYSKDYVNSDGFDVDIAFKMIKETWETYPDISYTTNIENIEFSDNYATVLVNEAAFAAPTEIIGDYRTVGELYSKSKCVYHLEKAGQKWLISSERVIDEVSTLKFGEARFVNMELNVPKQIGSGKTYTTTLKVDTPPNVTMVGSISRKDISYPAKENEEVFRRISDNVLERVFTANKDNINESVAASVGFTHAEGYDESKIRVYLSGLAFIMTRVNVIPENKLIKSEAENEQNK